MHDDLSVIEIGCGTGELLAQIKGSRKVGIDFSVFMIEAARNQFPQLEFHVMDGENITLTEKFDVIILSNLVGWLVDVQKCFNEIKKLCHPGTRVVITHYNFLWEPFIKFAEFIGIKKKTPYQNWLTRGDILNILALGDFDVYRHNRNMLIPVNIPGISFIFNRYIGFKSIYLRPARYKDFQRNTFLFNISHYPCTQRKRQYRKCRAPAP
jgi:SAM-dependent methyltransferase